MINRMWGLLKSVLRTSPHDQQIVSNTTISSTTEIMIICHMANRAMLSSTTVCSCQAFTLWLPNQRAVRDTAVFCKSVLWYLRTNREWVAALWLSLQTGSSKLNPWLIGSEWQCSFLSKAVLSTLNPVCEQTGFSANVITYHQSNSMWVTLQFFLQWISSHIDHWLTGCEWYCDYLSQGNDHTTFHDKQIVSTTLHFFLLKAFYCTLSTNRLWVTLWCCLAVLL